VQKCLRKTRNERILASLDQQTQVRKHQENSMNKTINTGNNETLSRGVFKNADGTFTAMTYSQSKTFKTEAGAVRWFSAKTAS
jgi:hypothetical protein